MSEKKPKLNKEEKEAKKIATAEANKKRDARRERALFLHLSGASYRQIADQISKEGEEISKSTVEKDINLLLDDEKADGKTAMRLRKLQSKRLNQLILAHWVAAAGGNLKSGYFVRTLMKDLSELGGANAPLQIEQRGQVDAVQYTLAEWKAEQQKRREQAARTAQLFQDDE